MEFFFGKNNSMSLRKFFIKNKFSYKFYLIYNLFVRHKAFIKRLSYSQWGEDLEIIKFFKNKKKKIIIIEGASWCLFSYIIIKCLKIFIKNINLISCQ